MIRPINTVKPPPPPRVDPKAQAEQTTRLQAEATKLQNEIRLANRMGEVDAAAGARQRLTQVNAELKTAQPTAPMQPGPELPAAVTAATGNGVATAAPALFTQDLGGAPNLVVSPEVKAPEVKALEVNAPDIKANDILKAIDGGKSIDNIAAEQRVAPEDVVAALNAGGMTAVATEHANGDTRTVVITAGNRTITENQDYQHGGYYTQETGLDMQAKSSPIRDDLGRKETTSVDAQTGAITTTLVDDLGDGAVTERTTNPQTRETTTTETTGNGAVTVTSNLPNGSTVQTVTPAGGPALPVTTVTAPDGEVTTLAQSQTADGSGVAAIEEQLAAGKSIDEIAEASNLTPEQVIAEMNAAGLEVTQGGDPGETLQTVVTDPNTGRTATYNNDYHHGSRSSTITEGSTETTSMVDGNGVTTQTERNTETGEQTTTIVDPVNNTETKIVVDKDGRRIETIVETLNDGEPIDYEVKPGDNLSDIAEANGVTLDDLAVSNPELFTNPRDPDLIHPGETVVIDGATRTTVNVTFNGYTMNTSPDGKITLTNAATGAVTDIAAGTAQQALAELLLDINPNSSDPQQAKEDQIVKTALDGIFGGATPELTADALEKQQAVVAAMEAYGAPVPATPQLEGTPTSVGPFGEPPSATAPSGGKWVPLLVDGNWQWYDPEVAKAIAAENVAVSRLGEAQATSVQSQAQLDVYALDPAYKEAMEAAEATLDDTLAPYGLELKPTEPKGTLAEAQERLSLANSALEDAATAAAEYQAGQQSLLDAIAKQVDLPAISDPNQAAVRSPDGPSAEEANQDAKAEHAEVAQLLIDSALHTANGNKATVDQLVASTELELKLTDAKPGTPEYTAIEERLQGLQTLQGAAANQVTLAEAYQEYGIAQKAAADLAVTVEPLKQELLAQARERNPHHFDWEGFTNGRGEFTGKILSQDIVEENGQLYVVTVYENATFTDENGDDTNVHKSALTYDLNDENIRQDFRDDPLNKQWQEMLASTDVSSAPVCTANANGSQSALDAARSKIVDVQVNNLDAALKDARAALVDATAARDQAITDHGPGTVEAPAGTLKPGETAVQVTVSGRDMWVAPEVAAAYEAQGPGAIGESGKSVQIEMDGQKLWVSPELAAAEINHDQAETQKDQLEDWEQNVRPAMLAGRDWYAFSASKPKLLEYGSGEEYEAKLKSQYFEERQDQAMAGYQVRFESLYESGFTGEYKTYAPGELSGTVAQTLGQDPSSEGVGKVVDEIADRAGDDAEVKIVPIFSLDGGMESSTALFAIKSGGNEAGYVDSAGKYYSSFDEFQHENRLFSGNGNLVMAKGGDMSLGKDGFSLDELEVADARKVDFWDKASDIGLGLLAGAATIVSFVPGGQWAIPIAVGAGSILGGKALYKEADHLLQGGDFDSQSAWNVATGVTAFLPVGAGALRTYGLAKTGLSFGKASAGGFGMTHMNEVKWGIGRFQVKVDKAQYADDVSAFMQSGNKLTNAAWDLDAAAVVTGVPLLGKSVQDLVANWGDMDMLELANAIVGIGVGTVGTGLGGRSLLNNMPGAGGTRNGPHGSASFPNAGGADVPTGPRALPPGDGDGQPPPTGGRFDPPGDGQSSRPMVVHEQGADGTVVNVHDEGPSAPGERGDPKNASDQDAQAAREQNVPADGDPIVVPPARGDATTRPADSGMRLVWDPATKTFTGTPGPSGAKPSEGGAEGSRPLMRYTVGNRHTGEMLVDFNLPEGQRVVAIPEPRANTAPPEPVPAPVELDPSLPVLYLGADGRWTADPNARTEPPVVTDSGHPSPVRPDGTPIINNFSSNPYSFGQTFTAVKAGLRRIGTRYLNTEPRYDYPKLGELVDSIYHRPVAQDGVTAGQDIYVEAGGEYLPAKVVVAGPQASMTRDVVPLGEHATEAGYLGPDPTVERAKRGSITTPNGQNRVNTPAREVQTFKPADNPEVSHRSALGEILATTLPALPDDAATPALTWTPEQLELVGDYLNSLERSSDLVVRDAVTMTRVQLGGKGLPQSGTEMTQAQHHALGEMLNADRNSPFTGSKPAGQLSKNGLTTLQVFSAQGKLPHLSPGEVIDQIGLSSDARLTGGEQFLTAGALPGEAGWTDAGRDIVGDYLKAASRSTDPNLAAAANAASPLFKGRATKPGKAVTAAQQDALMQVLQADSGSTWVYGPKLQPGSSFKLAGELSPEGRYNAKVLSGHDTWTPYLWREMRGYAANQQKSADPAVQSLAHALENALPASKPRAGTEINSDVPVLLERLLGADKASSWRAPTFFTDAQGVWRSDRATVSWFLQEHEANVLGGPVLNDMATNGALQAAGWILGPDGRTVTLGIGSMLGIGLKVPLPSRQVYGELSLKNNGPISDGGTGFLLPVHPNDAKGQKLFVNGYRPNFAYDEAAAPSAQWVASAPMLSKNTFQSESATGISLSLFGFSVSGAHVHRTLRYLGGEGGRPGYTRREPGPLSQRAASFWEEAARGGASHYSSEGKVPGFEDRILYRNYNVIPPLGGGKEPWRGSPAFEGVPRETGAGPLNRLDRTDHGAGLAVNYGPLPLTTVELGSVRKDVVPHARTARAHPGSSEGAQKVFSALDTSGGRLTPDVLQHLDAYLAEVAASPHGDLRFAGQRVLDVFPELGVAPYPDQLAGGRPDGMSRPAWKALRQQLDQQARSELTPTQAHYLNRLLEQDVLHNSPPPDTAPAPAGDGPIVPRSPAPRREQGPAAEGSWGPSTAKPLTQAEIAANRQDASSMLDDMIQQDLGMPEMTEMRADLADQVSRSPEMMELLRNAHAKGVRIVNPARRDLRIFDPSLEQDLTATGSGLDRSLDVISVDADMFRTPAADNDAVVAGFVDALSHELSHVTDAPIDVLPQDFTNRQAHRDANVDARLKSEGEAALVQYIVADELAANGGKPNLALRADQAQADIYDRFAAGEIDRTQAVHEMAALYRSMEPSIADGGTYADYYGHFADTAYQAANVAPGREGDVASNASHVVGEPRAAAPANGAGDPARPLRGNVGPYVFRADTRAPSEIRDAGGFSPPPPTGIWVDNPQGIVLSNYVLGNTHGRFVGTSQSISGAKAFVSEESLAARRQGYTYLYTLNPSRPRLHVPTEFEAMGRPVSDSMARVDETAIDGSIPWNEVHGWRRMDPDGNFVGEFTRNEDAVAPGGSMQKRPQVILRPADEFWDAPAQAEAPPPPVAPVVGNEAPPVATETPPTENSAAETPTAATWPPAPDRGRVVFDPASGRIVSLELPVSSAAEPGFVGPVRAPTGPEVRALAADEIAELTGPQLHAIKPEQIAKLAPEQVAALSPEQVRQLTFDQLAALPPKQLRALGAEQLQAIRPSKLQAVAPGRITGLRPDQVAAFSQEQLAGLTIEQVRKLTPDQIAGLSDEQRNALTPEQVAAMRPAQFSHLNAIQFAALDPALVAARDPATMAKLSPRHVAALTREQLDVLTIHQIEALTKQQIAALTPKQLGELSPGQLRKFTPRQFTWMSTEQTNALSVLQLTTYRATHKKAMTPDQTAAVDQALTYARLKETAQLVATFGPMAGSSYTVWQILPPHWAATAAGVAFGVRGIVFSAQSVLPNTTANHKPLGRILNAASGASFIFSSPGSAAGLLRGDNVWVNGSFTLGNVVYGTKSALQSIAGRPVLRNVAEHLAGPGYVFGSLLYTAQNLHSPLAATAGALFTVGSAEFWLSAARTDLLNRRAAPRTPEEIDARAKSDARWTIADRIALGVTFGGGMLLFAWDALDDQPWNNTGKTPATDPTAAGDAPSGVDDAPADEQTAPGDTPSGVDGAPPDEQTAPGDTPSGVDGAPPDEQTPPGDTPSGVDGGAHADDSSNPAGRTNPTLEKDGYQWVEVRNGDSIRLIARTHSADVAETVVLNMDHIMSPDMIFSGDRIYLPATVG
ncbi:MAG: LysM peptidoglycan-binding domain-containing protein [Mesorhizobium sp.]|uniref:LysM peptidoglycan-binding domain-containing protein n=1 Tax=Mesorhizobium sp. TaxID=1871066 RepID=UPI000FE8EE17|nr:LysM peptidoglycan-binding domain-containing protein [Mesorhizobium sp.]RWK98488.1 MAG: LysM peptidoglycan-binding domain-containing protein [Mesorhizobium sp.]